MVSNSSPFQVDPSVGANVTASSKRGGIGARPKGTSLGHFDSSNKRGMRGPSGGLGGGSIYHMLISEQGVRERLAEARRQP